MKNSSASSIVLLAAAVIALALSNSLLAGPFAELWQVPFTISLGSFTISKPLLYWINDGLMSMFFFVVGLELKREFVAGELSEPRNLLLPAVAALGGMVMPAVIYSLLNLNTGTEAQNGWGIPMATDIAFTLGVLYLLGKRVPLSLKVFLTTLAIVDDLGAVLVIAFFYTSDISLVNLALGGLFLALMVLGNWLGVRSAVFYGILGIGGLWLAFLLSGVHATIAAVLAAFTIPASVKISKHDYLARMRGLLKRFAKAPCTETAMATPTEQAILDKIERSTQAAVPPLQKLEHALHPIVAFAVIPIFALANAGVSFSGNIFAVLTSSVSLGVMLGLVGGNVLGIVGFVYISERLGLFRLPPVLSYRHITGAAFLAAIGFTMSLFITSLAFEEQAHIQQAKLGILAASVFAGVVGYLILRSCPWPTSTKRQQPELRQTAPAELTAR